MKERAEMAEKTLIASVQDSGDMEAIVVVSPAVGIADGCPSEGLFLNPFDKAKCNEFT